MQHFIVFFLWGGDPTVFAQAIYLYTCTTQKFGDVTKTIVSLPVHKCVVLNVLIDLIHGFIGLAQSCAVDEINFLGALDNPTSFLCGHHIENMFVDPIDVCNCPRYLKFAVSF